MQSRAESTAALNDLVLDVVNRACVNFRPHAGFDRSPSGDLTLGTDGFLIVFNGGASNDAESSDSSLSFSWRFTSPSGAVSTASGISHTRSFTDSDIGPWTVRLTVTDPQGASDSEEQTFQIEGVPPSISLDGAGMIDVLDLLGVTALPTTDADGGDLEFTWELLESPASALLQPPGPTPPWTDATVSFFTTETDITLVGGTEIGRWRFRCTAQDNEGETDTAEITVHVRNLPPRIDLLGAGEIDVGEPLAAETTILLDDDGGDLTFEWDIVQVPESAGIPVQDGFQTGPSFFLPTGAADAGTWILRLRARDNEGEEASDEIAVLVDAPPDAVISGSDFGGLNQAISLSSAESVDPDSPCPLDPDGCHLTDGRPAEVSPGILSRTWSVLEVPAGVEGEFFPGRVDEVLGLLASGEILDIPPFTLAEGRWVFEVEVVDGEGNSDATSAAFDVIDPGSPPLAITTGPRFYVTDSSRAPAQDVTVDGSLSFDLDNLLDGEAFHFGMGISSHSWTAMWGAPGCPFPTIGSGAVLTLSSAGVSLPADCFTWHRYLLAVTDDDPTPQFGTNVQDVLLSDCPGVVCVEAPTTEHPESVVFSDQTDILIGYYIDSSLSGTPFCAAGCFAELAIFHETDAATPVFRAWDPNPLGTDRGAQQFFKWNGFVEDPSSGALSRPAAGKYTTRIDVVDLSFAVGVMSDAESDNIWIEVAEPSIDPASDEYLSLNSARASVDALRIDYVVVGGIPITGTTMHVYSAGSSTPVFEVAGPPAAMGTITWNGEVGPGIFLDPGYYEVDLEATGPPGVLGGSPRHAFVAYEIDLEVDGVSEADELVPGVPLVVGPHLVNARIFVQPAGLPGTIVVTEVGSGIIGPPAGVWLPGVEYPATEGYPELPLYVTAEAASATPTTLRASYIPSPTLPIQKEAMDEANIVSFEPDLTARCSSDAREESNGIFLERRRATGPVDFGLEAPMMRTLRVRSSHSFDGVRISVASGAPATIAVLAPPAPGGAPIVVGLPYTIPSTFVLPDGSVDTYVYARGIAFGDVVLALELLKDGDVIDGDRVRLRVGDSPPLVGQLVPSPPFWYTLGTVNAGGTVWTALDPAVHDERRGLQAHVYVVAHKTLAQWAADPALTDVTGTVETFTVSPLPGTITDNMQLAWGPLPSPTPGLYDVVLDFGDCSSGAAADGAIGPEDLILPTDAADLSLTVLPDLSAPGPYAVAPALEYGTDFEDGDTGTDCTPAEPPAAAVCIPGPGSCPFDEVCVDRTGVGGVPDGVFRCAPVVASPACVATEGCVNTDNDEDAHCRGPVPERITIPTTYDGLAGAPVVGEFRLRGRITYPTPFDATPHPLVVIAHGRHTPLHVRSGGTGRWRIVAPGTTLDQNYRGHTDLQNHLSSYGYITVSVDLDETVGFDSAGISMGYPDVTTGIVLRGWVILKNIEHALTHPAVMGHVDAARIHLLGHSRGGEGVLAAWYVMQCQ